MVYSREQAFEEARGKLKEAHSERDAVLVHTVGVIDELDKVANVLVERLREWYGIYFPELDVSDAEAYCKIIIMFDRETMEENTLSELVGPEKAKEIVARANSSTGAELPVEDLNQIRSLAEQIVALYALRNAITEYESNVTKALAPNISTLVEPALAAKLIAQAGGIKKLALFPASTVQVLGAEKALFKHLRRGSLPPKYGLIFQHPAIGTAPPGHGGKLARALAGKLAIAAKADAFSHNFIATKLKAGFDKRAAEISKLPKKAVSSFPSAPPRDVFRPTPRPAFKPAYRPQSAPSPQGRPSYQSERPRNAYRPQSERRPQATYRPSGDSRPQGYRPQGQDRPQGTYRPSGDYRTTGPSRPHSGFPSNQARPQSGFKPRPPFRPREGDRPYVPREGSRFGGAQGSGGHSSAQKQRWRGDQHRDQKKRRRNFR